MSTSIPSQNVMQQRDFEQDGESYSVLAFVDPNVPGGIKVGVYTATLDRAPSVVAGGLPVHRTYLVQTTDLAAKGDHLLSDLMDLAEADFLSNAHS